MKQHHLLSAVIILGLAAGMGQQPEPVSPLNATRVSPWEQHAKLEHGPLPEYPKEAAKQHLEGTIRLAVLLDKEGNVKAMHWLSIRVPDAEAQTHLWVLADAANKAVWKWKYDATLVDGKPVPVLSFVVFRFQLGDKPSVTVLSDKQETTPPIDESELQTPMRVRVSEGVSTGLLIHKIKPVYPEEAKTARIKGDVAFRVLIDDAGNVTKTQVISGHPLLVPAAEDAVKQWKFKPYKLNGWPIEVETTATLKFGPQ